VEQFSRWKQGDLDAEDKGIDQLFKQTLKEVNEELLKIVYSIKHETMNEIATGSSRVIRRDKNTLITLNAPLEITQKQPLAMRNFEFSGRQPTTQTGHRHTITDRPVPHGKRTVDFSEQIGTAGQNLPFILMINYDRMLSGNCFLCELLFSLDSCCSIITSNLAVKISDRL
jgi:hypothetical protein